MSPNVDTDVISDLEKILESQNIGSQNYLTDSSYTDVFSLAFMFVADKLISMCIEYTPAILSVSLWVVIKGRFANEVVKWVTLYISFNNLLIIF